MCLFITVISSPITYAFARTIVNFLVAEGCGLISDSTELSVASIPRIRSLFPSVFLFWITVRIHCHHRVKSRPTRVIEDSSDEAQRLRE